MALPHLITDSERKFIEKVILKTSPMPERDLCIWAFFIGTPCLILELNRIQVGDVIAKSGKINRCFDIRGDLDIVGDKRKIYLTNEFIQKIILNYFLELRSKGFCRGDHIDHYQGLDPLSSLFLTTEGKEFSLTKTETTYKPDSLRRHIMNFMLEGGIENPSSQSGRRTFATKLKRENIHVKWINHLLGNGLEATKRLIGNDPIDMGAIAAKAY